MRRSPSRRMVATRFPRWRVCENMSPAVSPKVVAIVLIIQNSAVTCGSFRMTYCAGDRPEVFFSSAMNSDTDAPKCRRVTLLRVARLDRVGRCCSHRNALYHHGQETLSAEPCGGVRHAIPTVECSRIAPLGRDSTQARRAIRTSDDCTLMVSPGRALGRYGDQRRSDPTAESHCVGRHFRGGDNGRR